MPQYYRLEGKTPFLCGGGVPEWGRWFETADRHVAWTKVTPNVHVSTVFLGIDHRFAGKGPPILFESMIFGGPHDQEQRRYCTWAKAEDGHAGMVKLAKGGLG